MLDAGRLLKICLESAGQIAENLRLKIEHIALFEVQTLGYPWYKYYKCKVYIFHYVRFNPTSLHVV